MNNKLYEFSGTADLLIKCKTRMTIAGKEYAPGEPYTYIKDTFVSFQYDEESKELTSNKTVGAARFARPDSATFYNIPFNTKITDLIFSQKSDSFLTTKNVNISCWESGKLYIDEPCVGEVWCYNEDLELVNGQIDSGDPTVINGDFSADNEYKVFYQVQTAGIEYSMEVPYYPYFEIEIFGKGNTDKNSNGVYMHFYAASFVATPQFNLRNGIFDIPLEFKFIYKGQKEPIIGVV